jgi:protocatechuate 3,4-dioxygenase, alpha subunit
MMTEQAALKRPEGITPSQTVGPFFHYMMTPHAYDVPELFVTDLTDGTGFTDTLRIEGRMLDADGVPMTDVLLEIWQADAAGTYATTEATLEGNRRPFHGFGRCDSDKTGAFRFTTIKPGRVPGADGKQQAPHIAVTVLGRGLLKHLTTRFYFEGDPANAEDAVLKLVPAGRRETLMLKRGADGIWRCDIRLGGDQETVFFGV